MALPRLCLGRARIAHPSSSTFSNVYILASSHVDILADLSQTHSARFGLSFYIFQKEAYSNKPNFHTLLNHIANYII